MTDAAARGPIDYDGPITHTHIGGQAVLEGIMMRGKYNWAVAVRTPDGEIHTEEHDLASGTAKHSWMRWPIVRGCVALVETLSLAMKAFAVSASLAGETEEEQLSAKEISFTLALGGVLAIAFFIVLPAVLTTFIAGSAAAHPFRWSIVDGVLRVAAFFAYIWAIGRMPDIKRVFAYHGAEHKTIHAYEHNLPLEPEIIQHYETLHVRCGTSFLLMVMIVAIVVFALTPVRAIAAYLGVTGRVGVTLIAITARIILLPLVAGLAYEITVKWAGAHSENPIVKLFLWPGMQLQRMTTREPDDGQVEVAVAAMQPIIAREDREAALAAGTLSPAEKPAGAAELATGDAGVEAPITAEPASLGAGFAEARPMTSRILLILAIVLGALAALVLLSACIVTPGTLLLTGPRVPLAAAYPRSAPGGWSQGSDRPMRFESGLPAERPVGPPDIPPAPSFPVARYLGNPLYEVHNDRGEVALTFDDGPSPQTPQLLAALAKHGAHATFFFVGKRASSGVGRRLVLATLASGNDVGDHTWTHVDLKNLSPDAMAQEIDLAQAFFFANDGRSPLFLRPRGGKFDAAAVEAARERGLILTLWSGDAHDIFPSPLPGVIAHNALRGVHSGSIIDLHDRNPDTVRAVPLILRELRQRGLKPVTLSQLLADGTP